MGQALNPDSAQESFVVEPGKHFHLELFALTDPLAGHLQHAVVLYQSHSRVCVVTTKPGNFEKEKLQFTFSPPPKTI